MTTCRILNTPGPVVTPTSNPHRGRGSQPRPPLWTRRDLRGSQLSHVSSTLVEINALASSRPTADAPVATVAAWYERKALVLHQIAAASASPSEHDTYESLATQAHHHAARLLALGDDLR